LLANFLAMVAYAQQESTLVQYLNLKGHDIVLGLFTALILTNTLTIILFQFPLLRLLRGVDLYARAYAGLALFAAGFVTYALLPIHNYLGWIAATWILSMGEAILFPTLNLQVDRIAPSHLKGSYFGASALSGLGFSLGPLMGGFLLQYVGGPMTFAITAIITAVGGLSYWQSSQVAKAARKPLRRPAAT
jgi:MFS family permease